MMANKQQAVPGSWGVIRSSFHSLMALLIAAVIVVVIYLTRDSEPPLEEAQETVEKLRDDELQLPLPSSTPSYAPLPPPSPPQSRCDLFSGKWVFDNVSYPLYKEQQCKFMSDQLACQKYGRKDLNYQYWRWQPHDCDLPRFNATALLERLRNKRLVFVGDSLNRGQWVSMVCLVESVIPPNLKSMSFHYNGSLITFKASEYNASIEYYWEPLLVESNSDDPVNHRVPDRIVRVQAIEKHAKYWTDADILVFDSYLWWRRSKMKVLWGSFESSDGIYKDVTMPRAFEMALSTWSDWLEIHINRTKTQLFFTSMSPTHERAEEWGGIAGRNCHTEIEPISKADYWGSGSDIGMMRVVESVIDKLKDRGLTIQILNITQLSEYRKDAHPTIYRRQWEPLTQEQLANPMGYADCFHWCLPGVPDIWNQILYTYIFNISIPKLDRTFENQPKL